VPLQQARPGEPEYPRTFEEFDRWFRTEEACLEYVAALRWPSGFRCPRCTASDSWRTGRGLFKCRRCRVQTSVTAGTLFDRTHKPLRTWFLAMWFVTSQKYGASALGLQRVLGLGSYETAWTWMHKLRKAMIRPVRDRLSGIVEVDETYVGGEEQGAAGRLTEKKAIVVIAIEVHDPKGFGRVRMRQVLDVSAASLTPFVRHAVQPGSIVRTDGWTGYNHIENHGYTRDKHIIAGSGDPAHVVLPGVHRIAALLKRWLLGTHQGAVSNKHLDYYLDEFSFRFNRRTSRARGLLFYRLMQHAVGPGPLRYRQIVGRPGEPEPIALPEEPDPKG
jgi:transposase-like protein